MNPELFNSEAWIRIQFRLSQRNSDPIQFKIQVLLHKHAVLWLNVAVLIDINVVRWQYVRDSTVQPVF
jgi:hypothetical protein